MARIKLTADQASEKWGRNLKNAGEDIRNGVNNVTEAPGMKAAAAQDKMLRNLTEAITSGRWKAAVAKVSLQDWKDSMLNKGVARLSTGVDGAMPKVQRAMAENFKNIEEVLGQVDRMPSNTFEDKMQRMVAFATGMHKKKVRR